MKILRKPFWMKFWIRILTCYRILFLRYKHWVLIDIDLYNLVELLREKDFEVNSIHHGTQPYINSKMIKRLADTKDDIEMMLEKAEFEAKAEEYCNHKK
jgi:hypothetical protein